MRSTSRKDTDSRLENFFLPDHLISASADSRAVRFAVTCNSFFSRLSADEATAGAAKSISIYRKMGVTQARFQDSMNRVDFGTKKARLGTWSLRTSQYAQRYFESIYSLVDPPHIGKHTSGAPVAALKHFDERHLHVIAFHFQRIQRVHPQQCQTDRAHDAVTMPLHYTEKTLETCRHFSFFC